MKREVYFMDKNINGHILENKAYDKHLMAQRNIYSTNPMRRDQYEVKNTNKKVINQHRDHKFRAYEFHKKKCKDEIDRENRRIQTKISDIQKQSTTKNLLKYDKNEGYRNLQMHNQIQRKRLAYDNLDLKNQNLSKRINTQKPAFNIGQMESQFKQNRQYFNNVRSYKTVGDGGSEKVVLNKLLVYTEGRFRQPGNRYVSHQNFAPSTGFKSRNRSKSNQSDSNITYKSQTSANSRAQSKASNREKRQATTQQNYRRKSEVKIHKRENSNKNFQSPMHFKQATVKQIVPASKTVKTIKANPKLNGSRTHLETEIPKPARSKTRSQSKRPGSEASSFRKSKNEPFGYKKKAKDV